ncbi:MAG: endolytic transglycosylase MltG [Povalibacter sp.]|jgi:UPF0755 protein
MRRLLRLFLILLLLCAGAIVLAAWRAHVWLDTPLSTLNRDQTFEVERGASLRSIAQGLNARGLLDQPEVWILWARLTGQSAGLKAGEYQLTPGLSPRALLKLLSSGQVILHSITFIEGSRFVDMLKVLATDESLIHKAIALSHEDLMQSLGAPGVHPEGQFFPDTYRFPRGTSDLELLGMAHRRMVQELDAAWNARAQDLPLATKYEALILASVVEKETALESERPLIAGVFVERLKRGMRLQTDPTVIYGIGESYDGNIRRADLLRDTPYNTYTRSGLPPTPIALPGIESLRAAVQPQMTGALFFVATGKGDGSHYFSKTLPEHEAAVKRYLQQLRQPRLNTP